VRFLVLDFGMSPVKGLYLVEFQRRVF